MSNSPPRLLSLEHSFFVDEVVTLVEKHVLQLGLLLSVRALVLLYLHVHTVHSVHSIKIQIIEDLAYQIKIQN